MNVHVKNNLPSLQSCRKKNHRNKIIDKLTANIIINENDNVHTIGCQNSELLSISTIVVYVEWKFIAKLHSLAHDQLFPKAIKINI